MYISYVCRYIYISNPIKVFKLYGTIIPYEYYTLQKTIKLCQALRSWNQGSLLNRATLLKLRPPCTCRTFQYQILRVYHRDP